METSKIPAALIYAQGFQGFVYHNAASSVRSTCLRALRAGNATHTPAENFIPRCKPNKRAERTPTEATPKKSARASALTTAETTSGQGEHRVACPASSNPNNVRAKTKRIVRVAAPDATARLSNLLADPQSAGIVAEVLQMHLTQLHAEEMMLNTNELRGGDDDAHAGCTKGALGTMYSSARALLKLILQRTCLQRSTSEAVTEPVEKLTCSSGWDECNSSRGPQWRVSLGRRDPPLCIYYLVSSAIVTASFHAVELWEPTGKLSLQYGF